MILKASLLLSTLAGTIILFAHSPAALAEASICENAFNPAPEATGLYRIVRQQETSDWLNADDKKQITNLVTSKGQPGAEPAFQVFLAARLRSVDPSIVPIIQALNLKPEVETIPGILDGVYVREEYDMMGTIYKNAVLSLTYPPKLQNTVIDFFIRAHELEHAIQTETEKSVRSKGYDGLQTYYSNGLGRFLMEQGAMINEWRFLNALPQSSLDEAIVLVNTLQIPDDRKAFLVRCLSSAKKSMSDYLKTQYQAGRYNRESFRPAKSGV
jgi:hypothetical protein